MAICFSNEVIIIGSKIRVLIKLEDCKLIIVIIHSLSNDESLNTLLSIESSYCTLGRRIVKLRYLHALLPDTLQRFQNIFPVNGLNTNLEEALPRAE